jgi:hypothetical protein
LLHDWIRTIGDKNLGRIKKMRFKMCGGWSQEFPASQKQPIHICEENVWPKCFFFLRNRLKLDELKIVFEWEDVSTKQGYGQEEWEEVTKWRNKVMAELKK